MTEAEQLALEQERGRALELEARARSMPAPDETRPITPGEANRAIETVRSRDPLTAEPSNTGAMSQFNRGVANFGDMLNPFDNTAQLMRGAGIGVAEGGADNAWQSFQRGTGEGLAAVVPIAQAGRLLGTASGVAGNIGRQVATSLGTRGGIAAEGIAGGTAQAASDEVRRRGGPAWMQQAAGVAAPVGVLGALQGARAVLQRTPGAQIARRGMDSVTAAVAPYTDAGARSVARRRMTDLAGGPERAEAMAGRVTPTERTAGVEVPDNLLNITPAQQTNDPNFLGLERLVRSQSPNVRERLDARRAASEQEAGAQISGMGGDEAAARDFFTQRRTEFASRLRQDAASAMDQAERRITALSNQSDEAVNSSIVREEIDNAYARARQEESRLWDQVPKGVQLMALESQPLARDIVENTTWAQQRNVPQVLRDFVERPDEQTVQELHDLYSELRRVAREADAGPVANSRVSANANRVADAILRDLGAVDGQTQIGRAINEARAYSREMHNTFDQGAVGELTIQTRQGGDRVDPTLTLDRTLRSGGQRAATAGRDLSEGMGFDGRDTTRGQAAIEDYLRDRFQQSAVSPSGEFTFDNARRFFRDNQALLNQYPNLRDEILGAVRNGENSQRIQSRIAGVVQQSQRDRAGALSRYLDRPPEQAFQAVLQSPNAAREARILVNAARKDESGQALAGLKGSFADYLIRQSTGTREGRTGIQGEGLAARLADPQVRRALGVVFSPAERGRLDRIAQELTSAQRAMTDAADVGTTISGEPGSRILEYLARTQAARVGGQAGGGSMGGSLQTANIFSGRAGEIAFRLFADKSSQILADAIEDPDLFRALLMEGNSVNIERELLPRLLPYLAGGAAATMTED